jgi:triacylglycerol lipase
LNQNLFRSFGALSLVLAAACGGDDRSSPVDAAPGNVEGEEPSPGFTLAPVFQSCEATPRTVAFDPAATALTPEAAYLMLWASTAAYGDEAVAGKPLEDAGFKAVRFLDGKATAGEATEGFQGFVAAAPGLRIVALRGSSEDKDWLNNSREGTVSGGPMNLPGFVHDGFSRQFREGLPLVTEALAQVGDPADPVWVTGHSLGAALATLMGVRLTRDGLPVKGVVTFAGPRAGDTTFAAEAKALLGDRLVRVTRDDDLITKAPSSPATADIASRVTTFGQGDVLRLFKRGQFELAHYAHAGAPTVVDPQTGRLALASGWNDAADQPFYENFLARVEAITDVPPKDAFGKVFAAAMKESHDVPNYGCALLKPLQTPAP